MKRRKFRLIVIVEKDDNSDKSVEERCGIVTAWAQDILDTAIDQSALSRILDRTAHVIECTEIIE